MPLCRLASFVVRSAPAYHNLLTLLIRISTTLSFLARPLSEAPLLQERLRHFRAPNRQPFMFCRLIPHRSILIDKVSISIMLDHEPGDIPPIVEDLTAQDMPSDTPYRIILLLLEPLVTENLSIEIVDFVRRMMNVFLLTINRSRHEEGMVVDRSLTTVDGAKEGDFLAAGFASFGVDLFFRDVENVGWVEVEVLGVPSHLGGEVVDIDAEMAELEEGFRQLRCTRGKSLGLTLWTAAGPGSYLWNFFTLGLSVSSFNNILAGFALSSLTSACP